MGFSNLVYGFSRVVYAATLVKHVVQVVLFSTDLCINVCIYINHTGRNNGSKLLGLLHNTESVVIQCTELQCTATDQGM